MDKSDSLFRVIIPSTHSLKISNMRQAYAKKLLHFAPYGLCIWFLISTIFLYIYYLRVISEKPAYEDSREKFIDFRLPGNPQAEDFERFYGGHLNVLKEQFGWNKYDCKMDSASKTLWCSSFLLAISILWFGLRKKILKSKLLPNIFIVFSVLSFILAIFPVYCAYREVKFMKEYSHLSLPGTSYVSNNPNMENIYLKKFQAENEELIKYYFYEKRKINIYSYGTIAITFLFSSIIFFLWAIDRKYSTLKLFENGDL